MAKSENRSTFFPDVCGNVARLAVRPVTARTAAPFLDRIRRVLVQPLFVAAALLMVMGLARTAQAQISPGRLASPHHNLEGPTNCTKCHTQSVRERSFRCTECHHEIAAELTQHRGLHSTYPMPCQPGAACAKCHSDHKGENFGMLHWDPTAKGFDHTKTGYVLDGKHTSVTCRSCHQAKNIPASALRLLHEKDLSHTYIE